MLARNDDTAVTNSTVSRCSTLSSASSNTNALPPRVDVLSTHSGHGSSTAFASTHLYIHTSTYAVCNDPVRSTARACLTAFIRPTTITAQVLRNFTDVRAVHNQNLRNMPRTPRTNHTAASAIQAARASVDAGPARSRQEIVLTVDMLRRLDEELTAMVATIEHAAERRAAVPAAVAASVDAILAASPLPEYVVEHWTIKSVSVTDNVMSVTLRRADDTERVVTVTRMSDTYTTEAQVLRAFTATVVHLKTNHMFAFDNASQILDFVAGNLMLMCTLTDNTFSERVACEVVLKQIAERVSVELDCSSGECRLSFGDASVDDDYPDHPDDATDDASSVDTEIEVDIDDIMRMVLAVVPALQTPAQTVDEFLVNHLVAQPLLPVDVAACAA
jgi:hypothetical protein